MNALSRFLIPRESPEAKCDGGPEINNLSHGKKKTSLLKHSVNTSKSPATNPYQPQACFGPVTGRFLFHHLARILQVELYDALQFHALFSAPWLGQGSSLLGCIEGSGLLKTNRGQELEVDAHLVCHISTICLLIGRSSTLLPGFRSSHASCLTSISCLGFYHSFTLMAFASGFSLWALGPRV